MREESAHPGLTETVVRVEDIFFSVVVNSFLPEEKSVQSDIFHPVHAHHYAELFLCCHDRELFWITDEIVELQRGEMLLIPTGVLHTRIPGDGQCISIGFSYQRLRNTKCHSFYKQLDRLCGGMTPKIVSDETENCSELYQVVHRNGESDLSVLDALRILEILLRIADKTEKGPKSREEKNYSLDVGRLSQLETYLACHFTERLRISDAAGLLHISERQLNRIVRNNFGMSFLEVVSGYRIEAACSMLINSRISAEEIARKVGFSSMKSFYMVFKKKTGMTPVQYREQMRRDGI